MLERYSKRIVEHFPRAICGVGTPYERTSPCMYKQRVQDAEGYRATLRVRNVFPL